MLCDHCKKRDASVHMTSVINNKKREAHLCQVCAAEQNGASSSFGMFGGGLFGNDGGDFFTNDFFTKMLYPDVKSSQPARCPSCGMSYGDFNREGKFGCAVCYDTFSPKIVPLLQRIQGNTEYKGRIPARRGNAFKAEYRIGKLREELQQAIGSEEYERAAQIRDRIKTLEDSIAAGAFERANAMKADAEASVSPGESTQAAAASGADYGEVGRADGAVKGDGGEEA